LSIVPEDPSYTAGGEYTYRYISTTSNSYTLCAKAESKEGYYCVSPEFSGVSQEDSVPMFAGWGGGGSGETFVCGVSTVEGAGGLTYGTVTGPDGKCWMDRNLGATQVAASASDANAYGYYYQWGRPTDGHQVSNSGTTSTNADSDIPGHANFITEADSPYDWRVPQSPNEATLWAGANGGLNNVCPAGWHVPTQPEWATVAGYFSPQTSVGAFNSTLKLPLAGYRHRIDAALYYFRGRNGYYWSGSPRGTDASDLFFGSSGVAPEDKCSRALGFSVRCVKD
ncbi:MAG: FISUMP domain-containing protein, partial [Candidatus Pacebacteria bacterium]|nr:FISUMP domain-containing protein [Candidatus Paceibacterota bacterium]